MSSINDRSDVPSTGDERLDELGEILARAVIRMASKEAGLRGTRRLDGSAETSPCVTGSENQNNEVA